MFRGYTHATNFTAQSPPQKILEEGMEAILFSATIAGNREKDVAAHKVWKQS
jgi:hypothetical protein